MTGLFVRIEREGGWRNLELEGLTDAELEAWAVRMMDAAPAGGWGWATALARWIRDNVKEGPHPGRSLQGDNDPPSEASNGGEAEAERGEEGGRRRGQAGEAVDRPGPQGG